MKIGTVVMTILCEFNLIVFYGNTILKMAKILPETYTYKYIYIYIYIYL